MAIPLRGGMRVALHSLSTATDLNGIVGKLGRFCSKSRRWAVDLSSKGCRKVKSENLLPLHNGNDADITPKKSCKVKLCRFGNACWRPGCHFSHPDEEGRRVHWVSVWSTDSCDSVQEVNCVKDFNEDIVELKQSITACIDGQEVLRDCSVTCGSVPASEPKDNRVSVASSVVALQNALASHSAEVDDAVQLLKGCNSS